MASCISLSVGPHCNSSLSQKLTSQGLLNLKALTQYAQHPSEARFRQTPPPHTHTHPRCAPVPSGPGVPHQLSPGPPVQPRRKARSKREARKSRRADLLGLSRKKLPDDGATSPAACPGSSYRAHLCLSRRPDARSQCPARATGTRGPALARERTVRDQNWAWGLVLPAS